MVDILPSLCSTVREAQPESIAQMIGMNPDELLGINEYETIIDVVELDSSSDDEIQVIDVKRPRLDGPTK
ncbi:hypothetical protein L596_026574 [Steinernema carpocapsae]|uniref:Uncharacterized protein n=1 Tax=Steinernema carpocapsae TaxID=34508 RepID=A0A4U5M1U7_STECR|nr:hypothetical protein L596_026574 [Steinernema carpocapsae]